MLPTEDGELPYRLVRTLVENGKQQMMTNDMTGYLAIFAEGCELIFLFLVTFNKRVGVLFLTLNIRAK